MELKFERDVLYREVWSTPISTLAKKYGISDNGLRKVCVALEVPLPIRGHWAKIAAGHKIPTPTLPATSGRTHFVCRGANTDGSAAYPWKDEKLQSQFLLEADPQNAIFVPAELEKPHRLVVAAAKAVRAERDKLIRSRERANRPRKPNEPWRFDMSPANWHEYERHGHIELSEDVLPLRVSLEATDRALRIWDAILKACESRGLHVSVEPRLMKVSDGIHHVGLRISEKVDRITRPASWGGRETVKSQPTGRLRIFVVGSYETKIEDLPEHLLELQLNEVLQRIYRGLATRRAWDKAFEKKQREKAEAAKAREQALAAEAKATRLREEELRRQQAEQAAAAERERLLIAEAASWRDAETIRAYATHLKATAAVESAPTPALTAWLAWADTVADKLDPTSKRLLGTEP